MRHTLGCVSRAHSRAMWEALLPISLMKCQYFLALFASLSIFPISSEYVLVAVSKPKEISISSFFKSPSIVFGHPITCTPVSCALKYSARTAALVLESSPPMMVMAVMPCFLHTAAAFSNCSVVSSLVLPLPMISKPPVFLNSLIYSSVKTMNLSSVRPLGPPRKPISSLSLSAFLSAS